MIHQPIEQSTLKPIGIERLVEWAFGAEKAQLEPTRQGAIEIPRYLGYGSLQHALLQLAILGCRVDTSGAGASFVATEGETHWDAEAVAGTIVGMAGMGAISVAMAHALAEHGRAGTRPTGYVGVQPRIVTEWNENRYGRIAKTEPASPTHYSGGVWRQWMDEARRSRKFAARSPEPLTEHENLDAMRQHIGRVVPISYEPHPSQIATARRAYLEWWTALHELRERLHLAGVLVAHRLTGEMPPVEPWKAEG